MIEALDSLKLGNSARKFELPSIRKRQVSEAKCCTGFTKCLEREKERAACQQGRSSEPGWQPPSLPQGYSGTQRWLTLNSSTLSHHSYPTLTTPALSPTILTATLVSWWPFHYLAICSKLLTSLSINPYQPSPPPTFINSNDNQLILGMVDTQNYTSLNPSINPTVIPQLFLSPLSQFSEEITCSSSAVQGMSIK